MGIVAEATHLLLKQRVAIKFPRRDLVGHENAGRRFLREARATFSVRSEHVVRVLDLGFTVEDGPFIAMEYLDGKTLAALLDETGTLPFQTAALLMMQAMRGVEAAHRVGLVHRDLKPSNLFITAGPDGAAVVKVLDFGIAKPEGNACAEADITVSGARIGSPAYMPPEQMRGGAIDARADIWALGVILYELIAGASPFVADSPQAMIAKILVDPPLSLRSTNPEVPVELEMVLLRCLQKDPEERPETVEELRRALAEVVAEHPVQIAGLSDVPASPRPSASDPSLESLSTVVSAVEPVRGKPARARRTLAAAVAVLALGGLAVSLVKTVRPEARVASVAPPRKELAHDVPQVPVIPRGDTALLPADVTHPAPAPEAKPAPASSSKGPGSSAQSKHVTSRAGKLAPPSVPASSEIELAIDTRR